MIIRLPVLNDKMLFVLRIIFNISVGGKYSYHIALKVKLAWSYAVFVHTSVWLNAKLSTGTLNVPLISREYLVFCCNACN